MPKRTTVFVITALATLVPLAHAGDIAAKNPGTPPPTREASAPDPGVAMNDHYLDRTLRDMTSDVEGGEGQWLFTWFDVELLLISDEGADRMRVITPVGQADKLDFKQLRFLMEVNFDRALDAKYAIWEDQVWATFVHPLSSLSPEELKAGVMQVVNLYRTYGTDFTSTGMAFKLDGGQGGG